MIPCFHHEILSFHINPAAWDEFGNTFECFLSVGLSMQKRQILFHASGWLIFYLLWIFFFQTHSFTLTKTLTTGFCYLLFISGDFYAISYFLVPGLLLKKKGFLFFLSLVLLIFLSALLRAAVAAFMNLHFFPGSKKLLPFPPLLLDSLINITIWVLLLTAGKMIFDRIRQQQQLARLEREKEKTELDFLRAQINPHFLFNALNTVYGHIDKNNKTARNILLKFSAMLRYQLYDCNADSISMEKELGYLHNYVALQQFRKEEGLQVRWQVDDQVKELDIAPLLLVVFIENAFKYVSCSEETENSIDMAFTRLENAFRFQCLNTVDTIPLKRLEEKPGIGLSNVQRRLKILYPGKHRLEILENPGTYCITLTLDLL
jgi:two-component system, LytTR family, sensor kinase